MSKNYEKYIQQGKNDEEAYQLVINDLGGLSSAGIRTLLYIKEGVKPKEAT